MGKVFGILLIVVVVWVGLTIFNEGTDAAFGGLFAGSGREVADGSGRPLPRRVEERVRKSYREHEAQIESRAEE
jgi:hypothetical protein